jgi:hypothetical protein
MEHLDVLRGLTVILAIIGYYHCLSRQIWLTLAATTGLAAYISQIYPFEAPYLTYWIAAGVGVATLCLLAWRSTFHLAKAAAKPAKKIKQKKIVIDGTNVMYWDGDGAQMATLKIVIDYLKQKNYAPIVFLDASSRHHLGDKSLNERGFAKALGLSKGKVMVCPAQTEADVFILKFAKQQDLPVLSNDRFADRKAQAKGLNIVKGIIASGRPILDGL